MAINIVLSNLTNNLQLASCLVFIRFEFAALQKRQHDPMAIN